jgi:DNA repair exonuclease SbcCD ATPase subunit
MGYQGSINIARFDTFLDRDRWESSSELLRSLNEELARIRSAFPSEEELRKKLRKLKDDLERTQGRVLGITSRVETAQSDVDRLKPRHERYKQLKAQQAGLVERMGPLEHDIEVHRILMDLLDGTVDNIRNRLGPEIGRFVGGTLSEITRQRYGNASVSEDLEVRIFSREKNGLITLDEVSGGTRDQVLLCLRLALSMALVRARMSSKRAQFLFLDEPVSSFDEERSLSFLNLIHRFSPTFEQVFVTLHIIGSAPESFQSIIRTKMDEDRISLSLA